MQEIDTTDMTLAQQQELQAAMLLANDTERQKDVLANIRTASGLYRPVVVRKADEKE